MAHWKIRRGGIACLLVAFAALSIGSETQGQQFQLRNICRLKGQETNTLQGFGLVMGLRGTGDSDLMATSRALGKVMQRMGVPMSISLDGQLDVADLAETKNVALVAVTAEVPAVGAQQGDLLDVQVNAVSAKSLEGGTLMLTSMLGPNPNSPIVFGLASGRLKTSADGPATSAVIERGCKMEQTIRMPFSKDGKITIVIDPSFADFDTSERIADSINSALALEAGNADGVDGSGETPKLAKAIDQLHIEVQIPETYAKAPITLITSILNNPVPLNPRSNRVVINEKEGVVIIGGSVEIPPCLIHHANLSIEAKAPRAFREFDPTMPEGGNVKLKALEASLNALDAPPETLIAIIKTLKAKGDLYGELIYVK